MLKKLIQILYLLCPFILWSQSPRSCQKVINKFAKDELLIGSSMSICVMDSKDGKIIAKWDEKRKLIPASTQKLITSATALRHLGAKYKYLTTFSLRGDFFQDSIFIGDLWIDGKGDPSFGSEIYPETKSIESIADTLAELLKKNHIKEILGRIVVNSAFIEDVPENPEWLYYDIANYYGAGVFGFNVLENTAYLSLEKDSVSNAYQIEDVYPKELGPIFQNKIQSSNFLNPEEEELFFLGSSQCNQLTLNGCLPENSKVNLSIKSAIPDPSATYELILKNQLRVRGILVQENTNQRNVRSDRNLYDHFSPELQNMVSYTLKNSVNLYCESFIHLLGYFWFGNTQRANALRAIEKYWNDKVPDYCKIKMVDGSGLSRKNRISAEALCRILQHIYLDEKTNQFYAQIYNATEFGSLVNPLSKLNTLSGKWLLKSGSMQGVKSYSGYVLFEDKPRFIFTIILNNYECSSKDLSNKIAILISNLDKSLKPN